MFIVVTVHHRNRQILVMEECSCLFSKPSVKDNLKIENIFELHVKVKSA